MLETPRMKLVKMNMEHIETDSNFMQDFYGKFLEDMESQLKKAEEEIIREFAEKENLSLKCAKYFINKSFQFHIDTSYPNGPFNTPSVNLVLKPKPVECILYEMDNSPTTNEILNECEKELLKKTSNG